MKNGELVVLKTFNGLEAPRDEVRSHDNYWKLIGCSGIVVNENHPEFLPCPSAEFKRVLIGFDDILDCHGLANHNEIKNTIWILVSDLQLLG